MPNGKPSGQRCIQLTEDSRCAIFGLESRPAVCNSLKPEYEMCGSSNGHAFDYLTRLEIATKP